MAYIKLTEDQKQIIRDTASPDAAVRARAGQIIAKAVEEPLREAVFSGDILNGYFEVVPVEPGDTTMEFELDPIAPGTEDDWAAFTIPNHGYIPHRHFHGDYVQVPIYRIANSADWDLRLARKARYDVVSRASEAMNMGVTKKLNDDGFHTILAAGYDRNIVVTDTDAATGQFSKRLITLMKVVMDRNGGGNSTSINKGMLTDLLISTEAHSDIANWNVDQIDEITRREIFTSENGTLSRIFGVNLGALSELGEGQEYQLFYDSTLSGSLPSGDVELVIGLDRSKNDSFVMPVDEGLSVFVDDNMHRHQQAGMYLWMDVGFAILNSARVLLGSL